MTQLVNRKSQKIPHSPIRHMFNLASQMQNVINFGIGEPDFATPMHIARAGADAACSGFTHYTANAGDIRLRRAIVSEFGNRSGLEYSPEREVIVSLGAMEALFLAQQVTLEPGDEVVIPAPAWPNYVAQVLLADGVPVLAPVKEENGFRLTREILESHLTPKTRAVLINTPANPTGALLTERELEGISEVCLRHDLLVYADEVYNNIVYDGLRAPSIAVLPGMRDRTVIVNSMSKTYAMCGWRVGWALGPNEIIGQMVKLQEHVAACAASIAQAAAIAALTGPREEVDSMVEQYDRRRRLMVQGLNNIPGFRCRMPEGTFYAFVNIKGTGMSSQDLAMLLLKDAHVVTIPGSGFGEAGEGYLRLSFATPERAIEEGLERMEKCVKSRLRL
jgi:aminotransferase